ncbi:hypothetical protein HanRHA438_Chr08g0331251 [Helianthus annuus]|nr:hypothetical protein HanRHA438_Chr08g0331251 [Helianthus annuus]
MIADDPPMAYGPQGRSHTVRKRRPATDCWLLADLNGQTRSNGFLRSMDAPYSTHNSLGHMPSIHDQL